MGRGIIPVDLAAKQARMKKRVLRQRPIKQNVNCVKRPSRYCACGCKGETRNGNRWIVGHNGVLTNKLFPRSIELAEKLRQDGVPAREICKVLGVSKSLLSGIRGNNYRPRSLPYSPDVIASVEANRLRSLIGNVRNKVKEINHAE
jgi:hypothetical protein